MNINYIKNIKIPEMIEGKNIFLRKINIKEALDFYKFLNDSNVIQYLKINSPKNLKEEKKFIKTIRKKWENFQNFEYTIFLRNCSEICIQLKEYNQNLPGIVCGAISLWNLNYIHKFGEIGIWLGKKFWGQGINIEAVHLLKILAFNILHLNRLEAKMSVHNIRAIKTFKKLNFTDEGVLRKKLIIQGAYHDISIFSLLKKECKKT